MLLALYGGLASFYLCMGAMSDSTPITLAGIGFAIILLAVRK